MRRLGRLLHWSAALILLGAATDPLTPYLRFLREHITVLLVGAALGIATLALWRRRRGAIGRGEAALLGAIALGAGSLALASAAQFAAQRAEVLAAGAEARRLGVHFIVGYRDLDEVALLAERGLIGGIYLARHNVRGRTLEAVRAEIDHLQHLRARAGLPPLIVAADQEGGSVAHMSPPLSAMPALASLLEEADDAELENRARAYGLRQGSELAALGVNLNFGPVVDLSPSADGPLLDTHTRIGERAIAADPALVTRIARAYGEGLAQAGVRPTFKHFPGLARVSADTHHFSARLDAPLAELDAHDWQPFRAAAPADAAIMVGHVVLPALDAERPASLSAAVVQGVLRERWGHRGLLVTDDLNMGAVYWRGMCESAVDALAAGIDLVLISYDPDQFYRAMACAAAAERGGGFDPRRLGASRARIAAQTGLSPLRVGEAVDKL